MADFCKFHWSMRLRTESDIKWMYSTKKYFLWNIYITPNWNQKLKHSSGCSKLSKNGDFMVAKASSVESSIFPAITNRLSWLSLKVEEGPILFSSESSARVFLSHLWFGLSSKFSHPQKSFWKLQSMRARKRIDIEM